ncbi:MAG: PQQ-binding-like beta-propeller repeat protein [Candidatus Bathyarchaeota archaeon]|nr:PQQ-binding-like beta-propeller repeat protein [Candidatus Bathyarchaeota archaeon]
MKRNTAISLIFIMLLVASTFEVNLSNVFAKCQSQGFSEKWLSSNAGDEDTIHSVITENGYIYVAAGGIFEGSRLYCLNADTGSQVWNYSIWYLCFSVAKGVIYVGGSHVYNTAGSILCLDASNGAQLWKSDLNGKIDKIAVVGDCVYVMADSTVYSFNAETGAKNWDYSVPKGNKLGSFSVGVGYICAVSITDDQNSSSYLNYVYALNASSGQPVWTQKILGNTSPSSYAYSISASNGTDFVLQKIYSQNIAGSGNVYAFDAQNGTLLGSMESLALPATLPLRITLFMVPQVRGFSR